VTDDQAPDQAARQPTRLPTERPPLAIHDVPDRHRYEARLGETGRLAAILSYEASETWVALLHTEVQDGFEGQGIGSHLVQWVIDDLRARGLSVIPRCPFVVAWLERHPEEHDILSHPLPSPEPPRSDEPPEPA
jgi:predicted GNAT family acetyltransferase